MRASVICAAALVALTAPSLCAQRLAALPAGTLVRIETSVHDVFIGPLLNSGADTVRIATRGNAPPVALPTSGIIAYSIGGGRDRAKGAWHGAKLGGGLGLVLMGLVQTTQRSERGSAGRFARSFAIASTVTGVSIGIAMGPERWIRPQE